MEDLEEIRGSKFEPEISRLQKKLQEMMDAKSKAEEAQRKLKTEHQKTVEQLQTNHQNTVEQLKAQIHQKDMDNLNLREQIDDLNQKLLMTTDSLMSKDNELLQSEAAWEKKCKALEVKFEKDLSENQIVFKEKEQDVSRQLTEALEVLEGKESQHQEREAAWELKYKALQEKYEKDLAERQSLETLQTDFQNKMIQMEEKMAKNQAVFEEKELDLKTQLTEALVVLESKEAQLHHTEEAWEMRYSELEKNFEKIKNQFTSIQELVEKLRVKNTELQQSKENCDTKEQQMKKEKEELEELCLRTKQKSKSVLFRKTIVDREAMLEKMMSKMQKEKEKEENRPGRFKWLSGLVGRRASQ